MQCDEFDFELHPTPVLDELDSALPELGMLSTYSNVSPEYLKKLRRKSKSLYNMLTMNTRYVSNVSIGFQLRPTAPHVWYKPYTVTKREERQRTRSENNDVNDSIGLKKGVIEEPLQETVQDDLALLKKAKSLESIIAENNKDVDLSKITIPEVQVVSGLEKLKVAE